MSRNQITASPTVSAASSSDNACGEDPTSGIASIRHETKLIQSARLGQRRRVASRRTSRRVSARSRPIRYPGDGGGSKSIAQEPTTVPATTATPVLRRAERL